MRRAVSWRKFGRALLELVIDRTGTAHTIPVLRLRTFRTRFEQCSERLCAAVPDTARAQLWSWQSCNIRRETGGGCKHAECYRTESAPFWRADYGCNIGHSMGPVQQSHTDMHAHPRMRGIICVRSSEFVDDRECQQAKIAVAACLRGSFIATSVNATCALFCQLMTCTFTMRSVHTSSREMRVRT